MATPTTTQAPAAEVAPTVEQLQDVLRSTTETLKQAHTRLLATDATNEQLATFTKQANEAKALGPAIVDQLIKIGHIKGKDRDVAIANMANPAKLAYSLNEVLKHAGAVPVTGRVENTPLQGGSSTKSASEQATDAMREADDRHRQRVGLS